MTAPDHRPFLLATDLCTAEDVAAWLEEHAEQWRLDAVADPSLGARSVRLDYGGLRALQGAHADLRARLDRERRQACRRGALVEWRLLRCHLRAAHEWESADDAWTDEERAEWVAEAYGVVYDTVARALAFRAAARAR